eukprot:gene8557-20143_t
MSCESCGRGFAADPPERLPKRLPCLDVFCAGCITVLLEAPEQSCPNPICTADLTSVNQAGLTIDRMTMELVASAGSTGGAAGAATVKPQCDDCQEDAGKATPATQWCDDCKAFFCGDHVATHYTKKRLQTHTLKPAESQTAGATTTAQAVWEGKTH